MCLSITRYSTTLTRSRLSISFLQHPNLPLAKSPVDSTSSSALHVLDLKCKMALPPQHSLRLLRPDTADAVDAVDAADAADQ